MEISYLLDWLSLLARWAHLIVGIAWIGSSFYFVWLDDSLEPPRTGNPRHLGELWSVHGGGFYNNVKFKGAPEKMPDTLHWFYWESYSTWITGFFLLCTLYYAGAESYLIDRSVADLSRYQAIGLGLGFLAGGWVVYDLLCKVLHDHGRLLAAAVVAWCVVAAYALTHLFSGRGAFLHFGAMLATIMSANVFFVIIPGQRRMVAEMQAGEPGNPLWGARAKHPTVHNTYFTLPVLFCMISNHYATTYSARHAWLVLLAISLGGVLVRLFFVLKHKEAPRWWILALALLIFAAVAWALRPAPVTGPAAGAAVPTYASVKKIIDERCAVCHAAQPTFQGFPAAPKGVMLDTAERVVAQATLVHQQTVLSKAMPIGNITNMTDDERAVIDAWFRAGAKR